MAIAVTAKNASTSTSTPTQRFLSVHIMKTAFVRLARHVRRNMFESRYVNSIWQGSAPMEGRDVKKVHIRGGLQDWYPLQLRSRGKRGRMVETGTAGGIEIGMVEEKVVGIEGVKGSVVEGVGLGGGGFMADGEGGIGIGSLCFQECFFSVDYGFYGGRNFFFFGCLLWTC